LICSYQGQEFVRVGYYVNNEYDDELLRAEPPAIPVLSQLVRNILADKPRVTRFPIKWDAVDELAAPPPQEGQIEPDDFTMISEEEVAGMDGDDDEEEDEEEEEGEEEEEAEFEVKGSSPEHQAISVDTSKTLQNNPVHTSGTPFTMSI
jgi:histone chaperone ASF1